MIDKTGADIVGPPLGKKRCDVSNWLTGLAS
jgi:hypothetical protein